MWKMQEEEIMENKVLQEVIKRNRNYYKEENKKLRKEVEKLENYIRGMKDLAFYLGGAKWKQ